MFYFWLQIFWQWLAISSYITYMTKERSSALFQFFSECFCSPCCYLMRNTRNVSLGYSENWSQLLFKRCLNVSFLHMTINNNYSPKENFISDLVTHYIVSHPLNESDRFSAKNSNCVLELFIIDQLRLNNNN